MSMITRDKSLSSPSICPNFDDSAKYKLPKKPINKIKVIRIGEQLLVVTASRF